MILSPVKYLFRLFIFPYIFGFLVRNMLQIFLLGNISTGMALYLAVEVICPKRSCCNAPSSAQPMYSMWWLPVYVALDNQTCQWAFKIILSNKTLTFKTSSWNPCYSQGSQNIWKTFRVFINWWWIAGGQSSFSIEKIKSNY